MTTNRIDRLLAFHNQDPEDPFVRFALATEYLKRGEDEVALEWFESLVVDQPDYVGTYYHLGMLYQKLGKLDEALDTFQKGIEAATRAGDFHALSELRSARMNVEVGS